MIDVAEKIFVIMAQKMLERNIKSVKTVFKPYIF